MCLPVPRWAAIWGYSTVGAERIDHGINKSQAEVGALTTHTKRRGQKMSNHLAFPIPRDNQTARTSP